MTRASAKDTAVVIPARNEEARIGACLAALAGQCAERVSVILVVNNTTDRTSGTARDIAAQLGLDLTVLERTLGSHEGVGTARKTGFDYALLTMQHLRYLLTTDADCIVAPDWIARNLAHLEKADAICGKIDLIADEADILNGMDRHLATLEGTYRKLVQSIYACHSSGCSDIASTHGEAAGASLAFVKSAYLAVGGFAPIPCGEDRRIVRALRSAGCKVRHSSDVTVQASCRLTGRALGGMSDALKARISGVDYLIDDCLPPAEWLVTQAKHETLGPWPPLVPARYRVKVRDLPRHIEKLKSFWNSRGRIPASIVRADIAPSSHIGTRQPDGGPAIVRADPDLQACPPPEDGMLAPPETKASALPTAKGA